MSVAAMNSLLFVSYSNSLRWLQQRRATALLTPPESVVGSEGNRSLADVSIAGLLAGFVPRTNHSHRQCSFLAIPTTLSTSALSATSTAPFRLILHPIPALAPRTWTLPAHNTLAVALRVLRDRGPLGFYRGGLVTLARDGPGYAVYFLVYEGLKQVLGNDRMGQFWAGGMAGVVSWASIYPLDVLKSRIQVSEPAKGVGATREAWHVAKDMWKQEGKGVFVRGMRPTLIRAFYVNAITFVAYEKCMEMLEARGNGIGNSEAIRE
ncbi:mitochondrial carrier domain-containing protein [Catenaria anguillulae PL171]|uniref:Mitochondrial carrier domain-containing protein n=1 Tax=Catenaria anguillulae PL171 TaxID=765915 RepID=A0A1Y2H8M8_9FUNG|nr:mitochondrial carrier domain-containing protein [Catenaria anguillulae PL171]